MEGYIRLIMTTTNQIYKENKAFIKNIINQKWIKKQSYNNSKWAMEDLENEAWIALLKSLKKYDSKLNDSFQAYAYTNIINHLKSYMDTHRFTLHANVKNVKLNGSFEKLIMQESNMIHADKSLELPCKVKSPIDIAEKKELKEILQDALATLSKLDKHIIHDYVINDVSFTSIGKKLGINKEEVRRKYIKTLNVLKDKLSHVSNHCN